MDTKNIQSLFKLLSKIVIKCAANAIAPGNVLITTPLEELGQLGVDKLSNQLLTQNTQVPSHQTIEQICRTQLADNGLQYLEIIIAAVEICMDKLPLFSSGYDAESLADELSSDYIARYNNQFESKTLAQLEKSLPKVLKRTIHNLQIELESDPEFQIAWKSFTQTRLHELEKKQKRNDEIFADHENRLSEQERKANKKNVEIAELHDLYRNKWEESLFLDDNIPLSQVYQLPYYNDNCDDLHSRLQVMLNVPKGLDNRMLVILGHPGSGKSTVITYLLNNCDIGENCLIRVYRFSSIETIDWNSKPENLPNRLLESIGICKIDLNHSILILDGLDEIEMSNNHVEFLDYLYQLWVKSEDIVGFSLIVTCRTNRIPIPSELSSPYLELSPLNETQIIDFASAYWNKMIPDFTEKERSLLAQLTDDDKKLQSIMGIPFILYMTLALNIDISDSSHIGDIYEQIFSLESKNSIYFRCKYDRKHLITASEAEKIHSFSKKIAEKIWELNPSDASIEKSVYLPIVDEIVGNAQESFRKLLIGQYFIEGEDGSELLFIHRSIYEYFVAISLFDKIKDLENTSLTPNELYSKLGSNGQELALSSFANLIGIQPLTEYPDIQCFLLNLFRKDTTSDSKWWLNFFMLFTENGLADAATQRRKGGVKGIGEETNRFYNLLWIAREQLRKSGKVSPFRVFPKSSTPIYLMIPSSITKDFCDLDLKNVTLANTNLFGADLSNSDLSGSDLMGVELTDSTLVNANLESVQLNRANLSGANLTNARLQNADLQTSDFSNAILNGADLVNASLIDVNWNGTLLIGANLSGCRFDEVEFCHTVFRHAKLKSAHLSRADLSYIDLSSADLHAADLRGANLSYADLSHADLSEALLDDAILDYADLRWANLNFAKLKNCSLHGAYLQMAQLDHADLSMTDLSSADLSEASLYCTILTKADLSNSSFVGSALKRVNLCEAELLYTDFSSASIIKTRITEFGLERAIYSASDFTSWDIIWVDIPLSQLSRHTDIFEALEDGYDLFDNYDYSLID